MGAGFGRDDLGLCSGGPKPVIQNDMEANVPSMVLSNDSSEPLQYATPALPSVGRPYDPQLSVTPRSLLEAARHQDLPPDADPGHSDVIRRMLADSESSRSVTVRDVSTVQARIIAETLPFARHIVDARFIGNEADDDLARVLGALLQPVWVHPPTLRCLVVANPRRNRVSDSGAMAVARALETNRSLRTVVLFGTFAGDGTMRALVAALRSNHSLQTLVFYGKALSGLGTGLLAEWLRKDEIGLSELVVGGTEFNDGDAQLLMSCAAERRERDHLVPLRSFGLLNAVLTDESVHFAARLLSCGLQDVTLLLGRLSDDGAVALAGALGAALARKSHDPAHPPLRTLSLASAIAGDAALSAFRTAMGQCGEDQLEMLDLALGTATPNACRDAADECSTAPATGSSGSASQGQAEANRGASKRQLLRATCNFAEYLEGAMFERVMLRSSPEMTI